MSKGIWTHEESYKGRGITPYLHRRRLNHILALFGELTLSKNGSLADFGCSNGFVLSHIRSTVFPSAEFELTGFDDSDELLELARSRGIPNASFHSIDLNSSDILDEPWRERFDIVTCFETIEHTGSFTNAIHNLYSACKRGGMILISMPNEKGIPGLVKYVGRKVLQKDPYEDFFNGRSEFEYVRSVLLNKPIDGYRLPARDGWGPHLGFDWEVVTKFIEDSYVRTKRLEWHIKRSSFLKLNLIFAFRKVG